MEACILSDCILFDEIIVVPHKFTTCHKTSYITMITIDSCMEYEPSHVSGNMSIKADPCAYITYASDGSNNGQPQNKQHQ